MLDMTNRKPFKGVISDWVFIPGAEHTRIGGNCAFHTNSMEFVNAMMHDDLSGIVQDLPMTTSHVVNIYDMGCFHICETKNSIYVLINPLEKEA